MSEVSRLRRVGHKGADLIAPGNTFASFDAAIAAGVDMIEFDVLTEQDGGRLILAHDWVDAASREPHTLEEALAYLASARSRGSTWTSISSCPDTSCASSTHCASRDCSTGP